MGRIAELLDRVSAGVSTTAWLLLPLVAALAIGCALVAALTGDLSEDTWFGSVMAICVVANASALLGLLASVAMAVASHALRRAVRRRAAH